MRRFSIILCAVCCLLASCKNSGGKLMPSISGKAGEVLVVIENADWNAELGEEVRSVLEDDVGEQIHCPCCVLMQNGGMIDRVLLARG